MTPRYQLPPIPKVCGSLDGTDHQPKKRKGQSRQTRSERTQSLSNDIFLEFIRLLCIFYLISYYTETEKPLSYPDVTEEQFNLGLRDRE